MSHWTNHKIQAWKINTDERRVSGIEGKDGKTYTDDKSPRTEIKRAEKTVDIRLSASSVLRLDEEMWRNK